MQLHLARTSGCLPLTLYDKIGVRHRINLEDFEFVLQKRARPFYPTLQQWIDHGEHNKARIGLMSFVALLQKRHRLGLSDKDPDLRTNFGFIETRAIEFDAGRFRANTPKEDELVLITKKLCTWLDERAPELSEELRQRL